MPIQNEGQSGKGKYIFIFGLILILGIGVLLVLWPRREQVTIQPVQQKANQEATKEISEYEGWGTYTNKALGYSFKYPAGWNAEESRYDGKNAFFGSDATNESGSGGVEVHEFSGSIEDYLAWEEKNVSDIKFSAASDMALANGLTALSVEYDDVVNGRLYLVKKGNLIYKLFLNSAVAEDLVVFDKLALTFSVKENQPAVMDADGTFTLSSIVSLILPEKWQIISMEDDPQFTNYSVFDENYTLNLTVVKLNEWLKGPNPDEGYVISHEERPEALTVLKNIYEHEKITPEDRKLFDNNVGEFLGYRSAGREDLKYFASADNSFRGISFFNTLGQDVGVSPVYYVSLYYPDQGLVVYGYYHMVNDFKELELINKPFVNLESEKGLEKIDLIAHEQFKKLVEKTPRKDLTFGAVLDTMDGLFKSLR